MEKTQNIYKILDLIQEDQRQLDRTIADLKRHKKATGFIKIVEKTTPFTGVFKGDMFPFGQGWGLKPHPRSRACHGCEAQGGMRVY